jgi:hypothetical protein
LEASLGTLLEASLGIKIEESPEISFNGIEFTLIS